jgi:putative Flp pilus-assembly TadE/G-like protein
VRWLRSRLRSAVASGDDGQLILLILIYTVIAGLLVTVVVDVSKVYLYRRSLVAAADGAALSAANQPDLASVYNGADGTLPLSPAGTDAAARQYAQDADLADRFEDFQIVDVTTDGITVTVTFRSRVRMPFLNLLSSRYSAGYPVHAVARARSPLSP